jgi:hypothetical protein
VRLVGDPAARYADRGRRLEAARKGLSETLALNDAVSLFALCEHSLNHLLPADPRHEAFSAGAIWLAAGLGRGAAMYVNSRWGRDADRWDDAVRLLHAVLPYDEAARDVIDAVRPHSVLASVALEGTRSSDARIKIYWRLLRPVALQALGVPLLAHPDIGGFLATLVRDTALPLSGLVLSAGFAVADGALTDVKIDLCAHCLPRPEKAWVEDLDDCSRTFGLVPADVANGLLERHCDVAFVGFGIDRRGSRRLNVYVKAVEAA